jgi:hypothetical protein
MPTPASGPTDPLGQALTASGWRLISAAHTALYVEPDVWSSADGQVMLSAHRARDGFHLITLHAPRTPQETEDPLWQIGGGPVPATIALAMAHAALAPPGSADHAATLTKNGWVLDPEHTLAKSLPGLEAWIGPATDGDPTRSWSAFRFPMPTEELSTWTVKGAHAGTECSLLATAATPPQVIAAAATSDLPDTARKQAQT